MRRLLFLAVLLFGCGATPEPTRTIHTGWGPGNDRLNPGIVPTRYRVSLDVDPSTAHYAGEVEIEINVKVDASTIYLHSLGHEIESVSVWQSDGGERDGTVERAEPDWLGVKVAGGLRRGPAVMRIAFKGSMNIPLFGMYRTQHAEDWYIFTQFEALGARQAFPCFDEPQFKTPFEVSITAPAGLGVYANSPVLSSSEVGQKVRRTFMPTPPMPTYLFAMTVGPLDVTAKPEYDMVRGDGSRLPIRILSARGRGGDAVLALRETSKILAIAESYFGTPYPYAKLDLVAVPDFAAGAMENPGLITYRDRLLLMDEDTVTDDELRSYAGIHAHELAHMWFGNLVTMNWWDDLWLNEAFATWFSRKVIDVYRPDWKVAFGAIGSRTAVMGQDSTTASRKVREPIRARGDIENAFDGITYTKGAAVLETFEGYVGETAFRDGVRAYLKDHAWGNARYGDLLGAIEKTAGREGLAKAMDTFLDQAGVPLVHFFPGACVDGQQDIRITQERWKPLGAEGLANGLWSVPVCVQGEDAGTRVCTLLTSPESSMKLSTCSERLVPNAGLGSYMVWTLPEANLKRLTQNFGSLSELDQVALLRNLSKLAASGHLEPSVVASLTPGFLSSPFDRVRSAALGLNGTLGGLVPDADISAWHAYRANVAKSLAGELGWAGEGNDTRERWALRRSVLNLVGRGPEGEAVVKTAQAKARQYIEGGTIRKEILGVALGLYARHGSEADYHKMFGAFLKEANSTRRASLLRGLSQFRFEGFPEASFTAAFNEKLRVNERGRFIWAPSGYHRFRTTAWSWLQANLGRVRALLPRNGARYLPYLPTGACSTEIGPEIRKVFEPLASGADAVEGISRHIQSAIERVGQCVARRARYAKDIDLILKPFRLPGKSP